MKISAICILVLIATTFAVLFIGQPATQARWGAEGVQSLRAISVICAGSALIGFLPMAVVSSRWPSFIGQAALGATALRLLLTISAGAAYQVLAKPHLPSFLFWAVIIYCLLLAIETGFGVYLIRRFYRPSSSDKGIVA